MTPISKLGRCDEFFSRANFLRMDGTILEARRLREGECCTAQNFWRNTQHSAAATRVFSPKTIGDVGGKHHRKHAGPPPWPADAHRGLQG
jgi:hypothetical protein